MELHWGLFGRSGPRVVEQFCAASMDARKVAAAGAIALVAYWGYNHFKADDPPLDDVLIALADEQWRPGFCYNGDLRWPCALVTDIELDRGSVEQADDGWRACFEISYHLETSPYDYFTGEIADPRSYVSADRPERACATATYFTGDRDSPSSWSFTPDEGFWWEAPTRAARDAICGTEPVGALYRCP